MYGVIKAAEYFGFSAKGVKGNKEAFFSEFPLPCIAHVIVAQVERNGAPIQGSSAIIRIIQPSHTLVLLLKVLCCISHT